MAAADAKELQVKGERFSAGATSGERGRRALAIAFFAHFALLVA